MAGTIDPTDTAWGLAQHGRHDFPDTIWKYDTHGTMLTWGIAVHASVSFKAGSLMSGDREKQVLNKCRMGDGVVSLAASRSCTGHWLAAGRAIYVHSPFLHGKD